MPNGSTRRKGERERGIKIIKRNNGWKLPKYDKNINLHIYEVEQISSRINFKRSVSRHVIVKMLTANEIEKILKAAREKQHTMYKGMPIRLIIDFLSETIEAKRQ